MTLTLHEVTNLDDFDYRGKTIACHAHFEMSKLDRIPASLQTYAEQQADGQFKVSGFLLGEVLNYSVHGQIWVQFPLKDEPTQVFHDHVIRFILDDEALPTTINNLPLLEV